MRVKRNQETSDIVRRLQLMEWPAWRKARKPALEVPVGLDVVAVAVAAIVVDIPNPRRTHRCCYRGTSSSLALPFNPC